MSMDNHMEHIYKHIEYWNSIEFIDIPLPIDKRKRPWPYIRKRNLQVKTWAQYYQVMIDQSKEHILEHAKQLGIF